VSLSRIDRAGGLKRNAGKLGYVPSLRDSPPKPHLPGTVVPGYRLFRPYGTGSMRLGQALRPSKYARFKIGSFEAYYVLADLEDILVFCRLRHRSLGNFAGYLEELPCMLVPFPGQHNRQTMVASMANFRIQFD
jgi:hypothetical protein